MWVNFPDFGQIDINFFINFPDFGQIELTILIKFFLSISPILAKLN